MEPLTEDDFGKTIMIGKKPIIEINAETMVFVELRERILKNQQLAREIEDADFKIVTERDFRLMIGIIDRLKKRIGELKDFRDNAPQYEGSGTVEVNKRLLIQLQEIMGLKEEDELTPEEKISVEKAEDDYKAGRVLTTKELSKKLDLDEEAES